MDALTLNLNPVIELTDEQFFQLCQINELIRFERNADGTLVLMPLFGGTTVVLPTLISPLLNCANYYSNSGLMKGFAEVTTFLRKKASKKF